jgi:hypothetical protein
VQELDRARRASQTSHVSIDRMILLSIKATAVILTESIALFKEWGGTPQNRSSGPWSKQIAALYQKLALTAETSTGNPAYGRARNQWVTRHAAKVAAVLSDCNNDMYLSCVALPVCYIHFPYLTSRAQGRRLRDTVILTRAGRSHWDISILTSLIRIIKEGRPPT